MARVFTNIPVGVRLAIVGLVPILAILYLSSTVILDAWHHRRIAMQMLAVGEVAPLMGDTIHELQAQRGLTVLALAGKTDTARQRLATQYAKVDQAFQGFKTKVAALAADEVGERAFRALHNGLKIEERQPQLRRSVQGDSILPADAAAQISGMIADLIKVIYRVAEAQTDVRMTRQPMRSSR